jgi:hypothetical protein
MKFLIVTSILAGSLAFGANAAMAGPSPANPVPNISFAPPGVHVAGQRLPVRGQRDADVAQFVRAMLGGWPIPYANLVRDARNAPAASGADDYPYSASYDASPVDAGSAAADAQAASDQETQTINEINDINAENASMAAAEEENDAANAATLQTEINAGM